jgi:hypothetical protein
VIGPDHAFVHMESVSRLAGGQRWAEGVWQDWLQPGWGMTRRPLLLAVLAMGLTVYELHEDRQRMLA